MHLLAAYAVAERNLVLEDQDTHSALGQTFRKRRASEPTADRDHIVNFSHASFRAMSHANGLPTHAMNRRTIMMLPDVGVSRSDTTNSQQTIWRSSSWHGSEFWLRTNESAP
jgi:hypothetical protein